MTDNVPRILPKRLHAQIKIGSWEIPEPFYILQEAGEVDTEEMFRVFNMGIGLVLTVARGELHGVLRILREAGQRAEPIGTVQKGGHGVVYDLPPSADSEG